MEELERRLAAVLNADVVGFTRLMMGDDVATVRAVAAVRDEVDALVREHTGRLVDFVGDDLLAEFRSALGAVRCAIELQHALEDRNEGLPRSGGSSSGSESISAT
jgi:class 3 adenylate cyclase